MYTEAEKNDRITLDFNSDPFEENDSFFVEGTPEDVAYEIRKEVIKLFPEYENEDAIVDSTVQVVLDTIICAEYNDTSLTQLYNRKRTIAGSCYTYDVENALIYYTIRASIFAFTYFVLPQIPVPIPFPYNVAVDSILAKIQNKFGKDKVIEKIEPDNYCVLLEAHKKKKKQDVTPNFIYEQLHDETNIVCPHYLDFYKAYKHYANEDGALGLSHCNFQKIPSGSCDLTVDQISKILMDLAKEKKYGLETDPTGRKIIRI